MPKQEILPPLRNQVARQDTVARVPEVNMGGYVNRTLATWQHNGQAKAIDALTRHNVAERNLFDAQTGVVNAAVRLADALALARDTPERHEHELRLRRLYREDGLNEAVHTFKQNVLRREKEIECAETDLVMARSLRAEADTALEDARQRFEAQKKYGAFTHELAHRKRATELLDVELDQAERRTLLDKHFAEKAGGTSAQNDSPADPAEIDEALHAYRQQLNAAGLDTSRIDQIIRERRGK